MGNILIRRRELILPSGGGGTLYHLEQGTVTNGSRSITVSGNHITITNPTTDFNSMTPLGFGVNAVNNKPVWFTIPSGSSCELKYLNIVCATDANPYMAMNFRTANASSSVSGFGTGNFYAYNTSRKIVSATATSNINVGALFAYFTSYAVNGTIDFDFEFYVNGIRWI